MISYLMCCDRLFTLLPLLDLPFDISPNAHIRIEVSRLDIRKVERGDHLWWLHSCVLRLHVLTDGGGRRIRLSGEACVERTLRAIVGEGRSSTLGRSIGGRGLSVAPLYSQAFSLPVSASDRMLVYWPLIE
jgi:hypothetical protein